MSDKKRLPVPMTSQDYQMVAAIQVVAQEQGLNLSVSAALKWAGYQFVEQKRAERKAGKGGKE